MTAAIPPILICTTVAESKAAELLGLRPVIVQSRAEVEELFIGLVGGEHRTYAGLDWI